MFNFMLCFLSSISNSFMLIKKNYTIFCLYFQTHLKVTISIVLHFSKIFFPRNAVPFVISNYQFVIKGSLYCKLVKIIIFLPSRIMPLSKEFTILFVLLLKKNRLINIHSYKEHLIAVYISGCTR